MNPRTVGALALCPVGNGQGSFYFLSISTGRILNRLHATALPMPDSVINKIHRMARQQKNNPGLIFANRNLTPDEYEDDDDDDDETYYDNGHDEEENEEELSDDEADDNNNDDNEMAGFGYNEPSVSAIICYAVVILYSSQAEYVGYCLGVIPHGSISGEIPNKVGKVAPCITVDSHPFCCSSDVLEKMRFAKDINH